MGAHDDKSEKGGSSMFSNSNNYTTLLVLGLVAVGVSAYLPMQIPSRNISFVTAILSSTLSLLIIFILTKRNVEKEYELKMQKLKDQYERKIGRLKKEHDSTTLEKTIRDGTQALIKNALDYFKIENIKNEIGPSAAMQNLQLDKYGQIIELLADFSLILPDYQENRQIVTQEIDHQIQIYQVDEKPFAGFLERILEKYLVAVNKKIREKVDQNALESKKQCPRCAEKVMLEAKICKHCGYEFKAISKSSAHNNAALQRVEKGKMLYNSGNYQEAVDILSKAIELKPNYAVAYYNRAIVFNKLGNHEKAESDLKEAGYLGHKKAQELLKLKGMEN